VIISSPSIDVRTPPGDPHRFLPCPFLAAGHPLDQRFDFLVAQRREVREAIHYEHALQPLDPLSYRWERHQSQSTLSSRAATSHRLLFAFENLQQNCLAFWGDQSDP
jgi:hypothetical protein